MLTSLLFDRVVSETESGKVRFLERRCLRSRFNGNQCRACLDECQAGALKLDGRTLLFQQEACTQCMRCASVCPNDAFAGGVDLAHLLEIVSGSSQAILTCRKSSHFHPKFLIPCIGFFSEAVLAAMNSVAVENFFIDVIHCHECRNKHCMSSFYKKLERVTAKDENVKLVQLTKHRKTEVFPTTEDSRRSYLRCAQQSIIDFGREAVWSGQEQSMSSQEQVEKGPVAASLLLYAAYKKCAEDAQGTLRAYFHGVKVTGDCNVCPGCQGMCPTGALKRAGSGEGEKRLMFSSSACSGCGLCVEFCKRNAIKVSRGGISGDPGAAHRIC